MTLVQDGTLLTFFYCLFTLYCHGTKWEAAWKKHIATWEPVEGADSYVNAAMINEDLSTSFPTSMELIEDPNPNVEVWCNNAYLQTETWKEFYANGTIDKFSSSVESQIYPCDIVRKKQDKDGIYFYTAVMWHQNKETGETSLIGKLRDVPREAFKYYDRPYTSDAFLANSFRHDIRIPDTIFPGAWKNLLPPSKDSYWLSDEYFQKRMNSHNIPVRTKVSVRRADGSNKQIKN